MCGIAGIITFSGVTEAEEIRMNRMLASMSFRGPDEKGVMATGQAVIGMTRLAIIDIAHGHQPMTTDDGRYSIVYNGELYNYLELRDALIDNGVTFRTNSDTEVLLELFRAKGIESLQLLNGMFGFAIWDSLENVLWVARDRIGIKPLFYFSSNRSFLFSSNLDSLIEAVDSTIDPSSLIEFLLCGYVSAPRSIYQGIKKIKPGHFARISEKDFREECYWRIPDVEDRREIGSDLVEELDSLLQDAVRMQMRSDVPVGAFLSGGLDSGTVVALASRYVDQPIRTFSIGFANGYNELALARKISQHSNSQHSEYLLNPGDVPQILKELVRFLDEPIGDNSIVPSYMISKKVHQEGIKVVLTGGGGDEVFGGYSRYFPRGSRKLLQNLPPVSRKLLGAVLKSFGVPFADRIAVGALDYYLGVSGVSLGFLRQFTSNPLILSEKVSSIIAEFDENKNRTSTRGLMAFDLGRYLVDDILALTDKMTMGCSLEARVPILDHRIVEFAYGLPDQILFNRQQKGLFRKICARYLPDEPLSAPKMGFAGPTSSWAKSLLVDPANIHLIKTSFLSGVFSIDKMLKKATAVDSPALWASLWPFYVFAAWEAERL